MRDARRLRGIDDLLDIERWASGWLGRAWASAGIREREPEQTLCQDVVRQVSRTPSPAGLLAVAALRRVAPPSAHAELDAAVAALPETLPRPPWISAPPWRPVTAWRASDPWDSKRALFVEYEGAGPHGLTAWINEPGGRTVSLLGLTAPGAAGQWAQAREREPEAVSMPLSSLPAEEVLADLADSMRQMDMYWPRVDDPDVVELRSLAWSRCREHLPELHSDWEPIEDEERNRLIGEFVAKSGLPDESVTRSLADVFVDYDDGYIAGAAGLLGWSPGWVEMFLTDYLPRKVVLDAAQRAALPEALRRWISFALARRGLDPRWITPVVAAVDEHLPEFEESVDDESSWGLAKGVVAELTSRGVDLTDREAVEREIHAINAARLARNLLDK